MDKKQTTGFEIDEFKNQLIKSKQQDLKTEQ